MSNDFIDSDKRAATALHNIAMYDLPMLANQIGRVVRMLTPDMGVVPGDTETTDEIRTALLDWYENGCGGATPLSALVWHEVDAALRGDDEAILRNAYVALTELQRHRQSDFELAKTINQTNTLGPLDAGD